MKNTYTMEFEKCVFSVINCITEMISNLRNTNKVRNPCSGKVVLIEAIEKKSGRIREAVLSKDESQLSIGLK